MDKPKNIVITDDFLLTDNERWIMSEFTKRYPGAYTILSPFRKIEVFERDEYGNVFSTFVSLGELISLFGDRVLAEIDEKRHLYLERPDDDISEIPDTDES